MGTLDPGSTFQLSDLRIKHSGTSKTRVLLKLKLISTYLYNTRLAYPTLLVVPPGPWIWHHTRSTLPE